MRISDWSSDVCSSDLNPIAIDARRGHAILHHFSLGRGKRRNGDSDGRNLRAPGNITEIFFHQRPCLRRVYIARRSEEHTSELQSLMRISYAVFFLKKKKSTVCDTQEIQQIIQEN